MTHPDVLHRTRACAKWMGGVLLVATLSLLTGCIRLPFEAQNGCSPLMKVIDSTWTFPDTAAAAPDSMLTKVCWKKA